MKYLSSKEVKKRYDFIWKYIEKPKRKFLRYFNNKSNKEIITKFVNKYRGEIMLNSFITVRLLGWVDIPNDDYYYVYLTRKNGEIEIIYDSCVGQPLRLKKILNAFEYYRLDNLASMNFLDVETGMKLIEINKIKLL